MLTINVENVAASRSENHSKNKNDKVYIIRKAFQVYMFLKAVQIYTFLKLKRNISAVLCSGEITYP